MLLTAPRGSVDPIEQYKSKVECFSYEVGGTRPGATGGHTGAVLPPNDCLCLPNESCTPPSEDCAPKNLTGSGLLECKSRPKFFVADTGFHDVLEMKTFFFWRSPVFSWKKTLEFPIPAGKSLAVLVKTFFFFIGDHLFSAERKRLNFRFRPENPFESLLLTLFI